MFRGVVFTILVLFQVGGVSAAEYPSPAKPGDRQADERLIYQLSYRGLLTSFIAKDLARVELLSFAKPASFGVGEGCRMVMTVDTSPFSFAEFMYPVRFRWESIVSPDLQRTLLVEEYDKGQDNDHRFYWMNWQGKKAAFAIYRKREKKSESTSVWDEEYFEPDWEEDDGSKLPSFVSGYPTVGRGLSYFIHKKTLKSSEHTAAIDGLTLIHRARLVDLDDESQLVVPVVHDAEVEQYRISRLGQESLTILGKRVDSDHVVIENVAPDKHQQGRMEIWLSRDAERIPLRLEVHATVGKIQVNLIERSGSQPLGGCIDRPVPTLTAGAAVTP